ncbi:Syntaxin-16 [Schistosoma japonicum]|nr:Syntaxin-16 [Schistosoma japonicum]
MAIRSLTESFTFMRNNASQNRNFYRDDKSDQESLVSKSKNKGIEKSSSEKFRKEWQNTVNSLQYTFSMIRQKMKEVIALHDRHLMASNLDDNLDEDQEIEFQTKELTQLFNLSHSQLGQLSKLKRSSSIWQESQESKLAENVLCNLARTLQDLSVVFRKAQSEYLNKLRSRDERIRSYLNIDLNLGDTSSSTSFVNEPEDNEYAVSL